MPDKACEFVLKMGSDSNGKWLTLKCQAMAVQGDYCPVHRNGVSPAPRVKHRVKRDLNLDVLPMEWSTNV